MCPIAQSRHYAALPTPPHKSPCRALPPLCFQNILKLKEASHAHHPPPHPHSRPPPQSPPLARPRPTPVVGETLGALPPHPLAHPLPLLLRPPPLAHRHPLLVLLLDRPAPLPQRPAQLPRHPPPRPRPRPLHHRRPHALRRPRRPGHPPPP